MNTLRNLQTTATVNFLLARLHTERGCEVGLKTDNTAVAYQTLPDGTKQTVFSAITRQGHLWTVRTTEDIAQSFGLQMWKDGLVT